VWPSPLTIIAPEKRLLSSPNVNALAIFPDLVFISNFVYQGDGLRSAEIISYCIDFVAD